MFDAAAVCLIRCEATARVSTKALSELKELISVGGRASGGDMVQVQQQSRSRRGGSDASRHEVPPVESVSTISSTPNRPRWESLSAEARQEALALLLLWLHAHARGDGQFADAEVHDEWKIRPHHLQRKAILYIRQSSPYQVLHNLKGQKLQYAMQEHLRRLGWQEIEIIDEDLGRSAAGTTVRAGFERMVVQVCLGQVGAVAAREVSRFARN